MNPTLASGAGIEKGSRNSFMMTLSLACDHEIIAFGSLARPELSLLEFLWSEGDLDLLEALLQHITGP